MTGAPGGRAADHIASEQALRYADTARAAAQAVRHADTVRAAAVRERDRLIITALAAGWTHTQIAEATGLTRGRVGQIATAAHG